MKTLKTKVFLLVCLLIGISAYSQEIATEKAEAAAQANNPLADMTALNFQDYYMPKLSNASDDAFMNTAWVRFAKPLSGGKLLLRVSAPMSTIGLPEVTGNVKTINGLGDMNAFMSYNFVSNSKATMGAGPLITAPTATNEALGTGKWQAGFAFVAFISKSPIFQYGALVTWQTSFAGQSDRENTNNAAFQPFYFWQLGNGLYLRGAPIWYFDIKNDAYSVPMALGIGKVIKLNDTMINCFVEPQYSMLVGGTQPIFQLFTGINLQFM